MKKHDIGGIIGYIGIGVLILGGFYSMATNPDTPIPLLGSLIIGGGCTLYSIYDSKKDDK